MLSNYYIINLFITLTILINCDLINQQQQSDPFYSLIFFVDLYMVRLTLFYRLNHIKRAMIQQNNNQRLIILITYKMSLDRTQNQTNTKYNRSQNQFTSCDAPPLDFSFKNIKNLEELYTTIPRHGVRKQIVHQIQQPNKDKKIKQETGSKQYKQEQTQLQKQVQRHTQKKIFEVTRLVPQNNIATTIQNLINNANLKNVSGKNNQQKNLDKKKTIQVKLQCVSLVLGYNKIRSLNNFSQILDHIVPNFQNLQWIDLSHNFLEHLNYDFKQLPKLRTLYLHCNFLYDMNDLKKLIHLQQLKTMTIHGNPLTTVSNFRVYVIGILKNLKKLDSVVISNKQRDNSNFFVKNLEQKYPVPKTYTKPPTESIEKVENDS